MQVFRAYFKIIKANLKQISIYLIVFLAISMIFFISNRPKNEENFSQTKTKAAFINLDKDTVLIKGFKEYLTEYVSLIPLENDQEKLQDALFYRNVEYIVTMPEGFTENFLKGNPVEIEKIIVPDSTTAMYVDMAINKYFNTAKVYTNNIPQISEERLVKEVAKDTLVDVKVKLKNFGEKKENNIFYISYFNYLAYSLFAMLILGVSSNLIVFNEKNLNRRNFCSPLKNRSFHMQLILANLTFSFICCGLMILLGFILNMESMLSYNGLLLCINATVFTIAALSISYLVGLLIKSRNAQSAIANVLSLGLCFLSGVFVPQELLSGKVFTIPSFNPVYWYIKANNSVGALSNFNFDNLSPIITYMLIELAFAAAIFSVALVVNKQKRITNS